MLRILAIISFAWGSLYAQERPNILLMIADDWSYPHASIYGDPVVNTPTFDGIAQKGALFSNAFCMSPSCTPSRASILTGRATHSLQSGANLYGPLLRSYPNYVDLLETAGYFVGYMGKGWGPGSPELGGYDRNPAGTRFESFEAFLSQKPPGKPFCFWFGSTDPHRDYEPGSGAIAGLKADSVRIPAYWPDHRTVRNDVLDYYYEVERFDKDCGKLMELLERNTLIENTLVVMTSDNGMPFPRAKANVYDKGTHLPLALQWPAKLMGAQVVDELVSFVDLAPTFLEACSIPSPASLHGLSLLPLLRKEKVAWREYLFISKERHAQVRMGDASYPMRAVRNKEWLYIYNPLPNRWPAGDPELYYAVGPYGDCDESPTKKMILDKKIEGTYRKYYTLCFAKRPKEELYYLPKDPDQVTNLAVDPAYVLQLRRLRQQLVNWMWATEDPRWEDPEAKIFDKYPYTGGPAKR